MVFAENYACCVNVNGYFDPDKGILDQYNCERPYRRLPDADKIQNVTAKEAGVQCYQKLSQKFPFMFTAFFSKKIKDLPQNPISTLYEKDGMSEELWALMMPRFAENDGQSDANTPRNLAIKPAENMYTRLMDFRTRYPGAVFKDEAPNLDSVNFRHQAFNICAPDQPEGRKITARFKDDQKGIDFKAEIGTLTNLLNDPGQPLLVFLGNGMEAYYKGMKFKHGDHPRIIALDISSKLLEFGNQKTSKDKLFKYFGLTLKNMDAVRTKKPILMIDSFSPGDFSKNNSLARVSMALREYLDEKKRWSKDEVDTLVIPVGLPEARAPGIFAKYQAKEESEWKAGARAEKVKAKKAMIVEAIQYGTGILSLAAYQEYFRTEEVGRNPRVIEPYVHFPLPGVLTFYDQAPKWLMNSLGDHKFNHYKLNGYPARAIQFSPTTPLVQRPKQLLLIR